MVSSLGSLGVFGALLSNVNRFLIMSHRRDWLSASVKNVCYVNDDLGRQKPLLVDTVSAVIPEDRLRGIWWWVFRLWRRLGLWLCCDEGIEIPCPPSMRSKC